MITLTFCCKFWIYSFRIYSVNGCKKKTTETAVHFVLKWVFEVNPVSNNSSNNSRMLGTKGFRDIASARSPEKKKKKKIYFTFSLWSIRKLWHHVVVLTVVILVQQVRC